MLKLFRFTVCMIVLVLQSACTDVQQAEPLRIGFNPWPGYEFIYLAKVKGFYEANGIDVKLVELNALGDVRRAFERGQIDIMASTMVEVLIAAENTGRTLRIIAVSDASNGSDMLLARQPISKVAELKGKRVGMEGATVDVLVAGAALRSAGLSFKDVEVVGKAQDDLVADLEAGRVDAIETYPPYAIQLMKSGHYNKVFDTSKIPGEIVDTISVDADVLESRGEDIERYLKAYFQAFDYYSENPEESSEIMGKREGVTGAEFREAIAGMEILGRDAQAPYLLADGIGGQVLQRASDALLATGWLKSPANIPAFFDPDTGHSAR
jgi:NitT/TauT family transport system substrate-binding protein